MKKYSVLFIVLLLCCPLLLSACANDKDAVDETGGEQTVLLSELSVNTKSADHLFDSYSNLEFSEDCYLAIPDHITEIYEYTTTTPLNADMEKYDEHFKGMFDYLFPEHALNNEFLFYIGGNSELVYDDDGNISQNFHKVSDWYNELISGEEGRVNFLYDETWLRNMTEWKSPVCLELGNPIGYGYAVINKGKTVEVNNSMVYDELLQAERYPLLESYDPADWLEYVETYSRDSTESFKLADKEMPIDEAVRFFENYINELPYPEDANMKTVVMSVDVYKVSEDVYGYYFLTTKEYQGVPFDHMRSGTEHSDFNDYSTTGGNAFMVESNDIDIIFGYYRLQTMESVNAYTTIVSLENAAKIMSQKLSDNVEFEVQKIELVYTEKPNKTSEGYIDIENYSAMVAPAWKFTLYNPNDNLTYVCYIDAKDGENFRYYKTPENLRVIK